MNERPDALSGCTYQFLLDHVEEPVYLTINNITIDGVKEIYEVFINCHSSKELGWSTVASRLISAVLRNPGNKDFLYKELQELFDAEYFFYKGNKYHSIVSLIGKILEEHALYLQSLSPAGWI